MQALVGHELFRVPWRQVGRLPVIRTGLSTYLHLKVLVDVLPAVIVANIIGGREIDKFLLWCRFGTGVWSRCS